MKLKGLTKLALSGVALAAVAATLGTSTYAWYISNTTATVTGAQGSTAGADTSGSLYAASPSMYAQGKWSNTVTLAAGSASEIASGDKDYETPVALQPVTLASAARNTAYNTAMGYTGDNAAKAVKEADNTFVDKEGKAVTKANGSYFDFSFYLIQRGDNPRKVNPKLTITNTTTGAFKTQTVYAANGHLPTDDPALDLRDTFTIDAVHALRVEITNSKAYTATKGSGSTLAVDTEKAVATTIYDADRDFETYTTKTGMLSGGEANLYYNDIVNGVNLYGCTQTTGAGLSTSVANGASANKWASFWLAPEEETLLTFRVWLEGTDAQNFDSCVGQAFNFQFEFELAATNA